MGVVILAPADHEADEQPVHRHTQQQEHDEDGGYGKERVQAETSREQRPREVHGEHHEVGLSEVHHPHDAKDQSEARRQQRVDAADQYPWNKELQELDHRL